MYAAQEGQLEKSRHIGVIAGSGRLPLLLADTLRCRGFEPCIVALAGWVDDESGDLSSYAHRVIPLGRAGEIIGWLKAQGVRELVLAGSLQRPQWLKLKVDPRGLRFVAKVALRALGDDGLLRAVRGELESEGFSLRGIHEFMPDLLAPVGVIGAIAPLPEDQESLEIGLNAAVEHGRQDKGQSVVVQQEVILGLEGRDGTAALMRRSVAGKSIGRGPILVKICKPQQDRALDMPTIGLQTAQMAAELGFVGIAVSAGETLILDREETVAYCNRTGLFLLGLEGKTG